MKRFLLLLLTVFSLSAGAQVYNNEWIDYNKTYYKFKVAVTGLYRISQTTLASIGLENTNADHFQLWRNGEEVPLYTSVQNAPLNSGAYIEFWGEMNDGKPDNPLYREQDYQISDKFSLQTDTAAFFLTVNPAGNNRRLVPTANNVTGNTLSAEPYFMHTVGVYNKNKINAGRSEKVGSSYTYSSSYDVGEAWTSGDMGTGATSTYIISNLRQYSGAGAPDPTIKITAAGNAVHPRNFRLKLNGDSVLGQTMDYYEYAKASRVVPLSLLNTGNANLQVTNLCAFPGDLMVVGRIELTYPRLFNLAGNANFNFELPANAAGNYLVITSFSTGGVAPVLYDLTNGKRYECFVVSPIQIRVVLEPSAVDRKLVLVNQTTGNIKEVTSLEQRSFVNYGLAANQGDFLIITHPSLTGISGGDDPVEEYRSYRSSAPGGSYNAKIYMIDQLEDQFGLGIKKHPLSIRNFLRWARANYAVPLKTVLLIGKGVIYTQFRTGQSNPDMEKLNLVPTFGNPASDNLLSAEGNSSVPLTPIGRISAINKAEVSVYLEKVKQYEQVQKTTSSVVADKAWMKNVVHVTGASDNNTSDILLAALNGHKRIIEDTFYAANVSTFTKNSADAVQQVSSARLESLFKEGIGILTYFGHSSASTLEFNLDNPENYDNKGKYPVFIVMGCNAGSFFNFNIARFSTKETISEKFVLAKDKGAIAFFASTHLGIVHYLDIYNSRNYKAMSTTKYGATLGEIMDEAIKQVFVSTTENDFYARFQCEQFTLHGDPAIRLYSFEKPDYVIEDQMVKVSPSFISVSEPNFKVTVNFMNIGKAVNKDIVVELKRTYPDLSVEVIRKDTISFTKFMDSLSYTFSIVPTRDKGLNKITITIDAGNVVDELYETNNSVTKDVYIIEDDVKPIYPYDYSIVNQQDIKLVASSADPFAPSHQYMLEIDTTELFNSPFKVARTMNSVGGVFEFSPGITFLDSTVYYWRIATTVTTGSPKWNSSSFVYLNGSATGFNQSHYFQHLKSSANRMILKESDREWRFDSLRHNIFLTNGVYLSSTTEESDLTVSIDDNAFIRSACVGSSLVFNLIEPNTFRPVINLTGRYGSALPCQPSRRWNFEFSYMNAASRKKAMDFMDSIPSGYYVAVRSINNKDQVSGFINQWMADTTLYGSGNSLYHKLKSVGFDKIDSLTKLRAFNFLYKKDGTDFVPKSQVSPDIFTVIKMSTDIMTTDTLGYLTSPRLGPAKAWQTLQWEGKEQEPGDLVDLSVIGVDKNGTETTLMTGIIPSQNSVDVSSVDASVYPFLKLKLKSTDVINFTPYQLRYWRLYYDPVPEGAIAPNIYFNAKDTVGTGQSFNLGIAFKNVSNVNFDSVKVKIAITDKNNLENIIYNTRHKALSVGDTIKLDVPVDTKALQGNNTIFINFNPDNDQPEQHLFNNYAFRKLYVIPDSLNPVMDVTFDGTHILNRDIISAKPKILIKLSDEIKSLILDDTSLVTVNVRYPNGDTRRFYFSNDTLQFIPASQVENTASVNFNPYFPEDGEYELIVSGKDRSGNFAGNVQYKVSFTIINKPMISNMLNYPNPFTTSTAFVFTVTGSEVPQNIRIQVLTITGKIVREITKDELGPLHIGRNITEFKWDGTDQYGQKLANGIYLYRVITNLNGKSLDKYKAKDDNTDKYFNKGYGKMYLMR